MFVHVACPENSLVDSKEYHKPMITPFELEMALLYAFRSLLSGAPPLTSPSVTGTGPLPSTRPTLRKCWSSRLPSRTLPPLLPSRASHFCRADTNWMAQARCPAVRALHVVLSLS
jgi:hypothetical protein